MYLRTYEFSKILSSKTMVIMPIKLRKHKENRLNLRLMSYGKPIELWMRIQ